MAMYNRDAAVLELLLKADSSGVDAVDGEGKTPMQLALTESPWGICIILSIPLFYKSSLILLRYRIYEVNRSADERWRGHIPAAKEFITWHGDLYCKFLSTSYQHAPPQCSH